MVKYLLKQLYCVVTERMGLPLSDAESDLFLGGFKMYYQVPVISLLAILAVACNPTPNRPVAVPENAVWVGSSKEGCFLVIGKREFLGWNLEGWDKDGNKVVEGIWELEGIARAVIQPQEIVKFDGQTFHLDDGAKVNKVSIDN
jgi:hypothetical protein